MEIEYFTKLRFDDLVNEIKQYIPIRFNSRLKDYIIIDKSMLGSQTIDDSRQSLYKSESSQTKRTSTTNRIRSGSLYNRDNIFRKFGNVPKITIKKNTNKERVNSEEALHNKSNMDMSNSMVFNMYLNNMPKNKDKSNENAFLNG